MAFDNLGGIVEGIRSYEADKIRQEEHAQNQQIREMQLYEKAAQIEDYRRKQQIRQEVLPQIDTSSSQSFYKAAEIFGQEGDEEGFLEMLKQGNSRAEIERKERGGVDPTAAQKKMDELMRTGVPAEQAQGIAYGTYKVITDSNTGDQKVVDLRANGVEVPDPSGNLKKAIDPNERYKVRTITTGNKQEIRLQKNVKELSDDMIKTGIPRVEDTLDTIEYIINKTYKEDGSGDLPGYGGLTRVAPDWAVSEQAQDLRQAATKLFNIELKERSGAAVTKQELDRLRKEFAEGAWKTDRQFVTGIRAYRRLLEDYKRAVTAGYSPQVVKRYTDQGGVQLKDFRVSGEPETTESPVKITEEQIRRDAKKYNWTEEQVQEAIKNYVRP